MKYLFLVILFSTVISANELPQTVNEAADIVYQGMKEQEKRRMLMVPEAKIISYNRFFGAGIRNNFGLWGGENKALLSDCDKRSGYSHPESCSGFIINLVWQRLKKEYAYSPLNKTFEAIRTTIIPSYYDKGRGLLKFVEHINKALLANPKAKGVVILAKCEDRHYRLKNYESEYRNSRETYLVNDLIYLSLLGQGIANATINENEIVLTPLPFLNSPTCDISK